MFGLFKYLKRFIFAPITKVIARKNTANKQLLTNEASYNHKGTLVSLKTMTEDYKKTGLEYKIPVMLGINSFGNNEYADLTELKSILMGGTTGSGKSVFAHCLINSLLLRLSSEDLKFLLIDMKRVEFNYYNGLPFMITDCIVSPDMAVEWLRKVLEEKKKSKEIKPYTIIVIDTNSDIMASEYRNEFEKLITQITNEGSDLGIYIVMYDSRVGIEVFSAIFLTNFKTHICFKTSTKEASQFLVNSDDGINLLGRGDMLLLKKGQKYPIRLQAPFILNKEIEETIALIKSKNQN